MGRSDSRSPSRRSPPRRRARSRSRSPRRDSPEDRRGSGPPPEADSGAPPPEGAPKAEVVESEARQSTGEKTYRAEIQMPKMMRYNYDGKARTMSVRGPLRVDREQAKRDAEELEREAAKGDTSSVKALARRMIQTNVA
uniref:Uncharacterized protein n=1 Tax=Alexandrium andersonii TaxID=327968 RepID=A0A7S2BDQ1_9DINO|mmetsp:Transcript_24890/g.56573  ORF Transcript_24890/g.56573 Transcript_24890/m.56573 type:complete len:139 (+) Transcript_24890:105-521(+)